MKKIELQLRKLLRTIFSCFSFTTMAFVFQACYGIEPPMFYDVKLTGTVKAKNTNLPVKGIKITVNDGMTFYNHNKDYGVTDENGKFDFYASVPSWGWNEYYIKDSVPVLYKPDSVCVRFFDLDGVENGWFEDKTIIIDPAHKDEVKIFVELDSKQ